MTANTEVIRSGKCHYFRIADQLPRISTSLPNMGFLDNLRVCDLPGPFEEARLGLKYCRFSDNPTIQALEFMQIDWRLELVRRCKLECANLDRLVSRTSSKLIPASVSVDLSQWCCVNRRTQLRPIAARGIVALGVFALCLSISGSLRGQDSGSALSGTISSSSGAVVPNAKVSVKNVATGQATETQTDSTGHYNLPNLAPGEYEVSINAERFTAQIKKVTLAASSTQTCDFALISMPAATKPAETQNSEGQQTKRMFWVVPNFTAVSANTQLPPLSAKGKYKLAMKGSVDYTSFIWAGIIAGQSMALKSTPELHGGFAGYGRYYWRTFVDQVADGFFTEAMIPALMHEDPRYYTLGHGGFIRRTGYALSQLVRTKMDSGGTGFNFAEILGNGMGAGLANLYYPPQERGLRKTVENWGTGLESAALNNIIKEFWPDIRRKILRQK